jgi:hypothetical protein
MLNANNIVNKCLGKGMSMPKMGGIRNNQRPILRDKKSKNMVRYSYFNADLDDGSSQLVYAGSKVGAKRILEDEGLNPLNLKELTYEDAKRLHDQVKLDMARSQSKGAYTSAGKKILPESNLDRDNRIKKKYSLR